jgi:flagellar motor switch protein FliG
MGRLPLSLRESVVARLAELDDVHPDAVELVEQGLEAQFSRHSQEDRRRRDRQARLGPLLEQADESVRASILARIGDEPEKEQRPPAEDGPTIHDLWQWDDAVLLAALSAIDVQVAALALAGAPPGRVDRLQRRLPRALARQVRRGLAALGPVTLADIEAAQEALLAAVLDDTSAAAA